MIIKTILIVKSGKEKIAALYEMMGKREVRKIKKALAWRAIFFEKCHTIQGLLESLLYKVQYAKINVF